MYTAHHKFFHDLRRTMSLYGYAESLHKNGFLPCQPGFGMNARGLINLTCQWKRQPPPLFQKVPVTTLVRGAYIAYRHQTVLGTTQSGGRDSFPYTWVLINKSPPKERITVWQLNMETGLWKRRLFSAVNTGLDHSTPDGSWPVFMRLKSGRMEGVTPTGIHYNDPRVQWINYFHKNLAVHGYYRSKYGFPQSAGCVELPLSSAKSVFSLIHDGTIVTITGRWHKMIKNARVPQSLLQLLSNKRLKMKSAQNHYSE